MQKQGTVARWNADRAFGFIHSPGSAGDVFFHLRDFRSAAPPQPGMAVEFEEIHVGGKGPRAVAVRPTGAAQAQGQSAASVPWTASPVAGVGAARRHQTPVQHGALDDDDVDRFQPGNAGLVNRRQDRAGHGRRSARPGKGPRRVQGHAVRWSPGVLLLIALWLGILGWEMLWTRQLPWWLAPALLGLNLVTVLVYAGDKRSAITGSWRTSENTLHMFSLLGGWPGAWFAQQWLRHKSSKVEFRVMYWITVMLNLGLLVGWLEGSVRRWIHFI